MDAHELNFDHRSRGARPIYELVSAILEEQQFEEGELPLVSTTATSVLDDIRGDPELLSEFVLAAGGVPAQLVRALAELSNQDAATLWRDGMLHTHRQGDDHNDS